LRSPSQVKALLGRVGVEVPDTRAWRLRTLRDSNPLIDALLQCRKAERIANTYGYAWLDKHLSSDGRLRGAWTGSDGAAGRMTASGGLHNMPADMRPAVIAEAGHLFVRADLGQIEPRVLAAISRDTALARATSPTICTPPWQPSSASIGRPPRSRCSAPCTGRRPATAPTRCPPGDRLPGGHGLSARRCSRRPGPSRPAHLRGKVDPDGIDEP
jgi:hypothetical protein